MELHALTQQAAAKLLSVTARSLRDWEAAGEGVPRNPDGSYPGPALVAWFVERQTGEKLDAVAERARKDKEHADKLALENAETRGELGRIGDVTEWFGQHVDRCCTRLDQIPDALGQLCEPRIAAIVVPECRRLIHEARAELAADATAGSAGHSESVAAAANGNGQPVGGREPPTLERKQRRARTVAN